MKKKQIPALCLSGGRLSDFGGKAVEYRVWIHSFDGDDFYYRSKNLKAVVAKRKELLKKYPLVEPVIAVVFDKNYKRYREVVI